MFLHMMNNKQKKLFLKLAIKSAEYNGIVELAEKNMIKLYSMEMGIEPFYATNDDTDDIISELSNCSDMRTKKIIVLEILGMMISDSEFDDMEKIFVSKLIKDFEIEKHLCDEMLTNLYEYLKLYNKLSDLVLN